MPAQAMILAAGRGQRMRPLTDHTPKPLLQVRGQALIDWHVRALARSGFKQLLVNTAWLGEQIAPHLAPIAAELGCSIRYSHEGQDFGDALETAGGIARALPQLAELFWVLAGDVFVPDFTFSPAAVSRFAESGHLAHLWLVPNPSHNPGGDFGLVEGLALNLPAGDPQRRYTFSTIGLYRREFFADLPAGNPQGLKIALAPLLRAAMDNGRVSAQCLEGSWTDVGTPDRLAQLNRNPDSSTTPLSDSEEFE
jgi:MurNAc alpha-1-phosphate uridylyltransferase